MVDEARDTKWRNAVSELYNYKCPHCGNTGSAHHIISRGCLKTKYILENGFYCCDKLHRTFETENGLEKRNEALRIYIGIEKFDNLNKIKSSLAQAEDFGYTIIE